MRRSKVKDRLTDYAAAELTPTETEEVRSHLAECEECRAELEAARDALNALALLNSDEPSPDLVGAVRQQLAIESSSHRFVIRPQLAMAAVICFVLIAYWALQKPNAPGTTPIARQPQVQTPVIGHRAGAPAPAPGLRNEGTQVAKALPQSQSITHHVRQRNNKRVLPRRAPRVYSPRVTSEIKMALAPRGPESYVVSADPQEHQTTDQCTVVRQFDVGGNVRSVTITDTVQPSENSAPDSVIPENGRLPDAPPAGETDSREIISGGYNFNA